jgi:hypothetical protein
MSLPVYEHALNAGWCSDVANPPQLAEIVMSMQSSRSAPIPVMLEVHDPAGQAENSVLLPIRATAVRTVQDADWDEPEYEFDGYVVRRDGGDEVTWLRGALRTNGETSIQECTLYRLNPGDELGTDRSVERH